MADKPVGFARRRQLSATEVIKKADEMEMRYKARVDQQKETISNMVDFLAERDLLNEYNTWMESK